MCIFFQTSYTTLTVSPQFSVSNQFKYCCCVAFQRGGGGKKQTFQSMKQKHTHMHISFKCHKTDIYCFITKIIYKFVLHLYSRLKLRLESNVYHLHRWCPLQKKKTTYNFIYSIHKTKKIK